MIKMMEKIEATKFAASKEIEETTFHLRLLLKYVRGPTSFRSLRTVDGVEYDTYKKACVAKG